MTWAAGVACVIDLLTFFYLSTSLFWLFFFSLCLPVGQVSGHSGALQSADRGLRDNLQELRTTHDIFGYTIFFLN